MTQITSQISNSSGLLKALEAITNRRAFISLMAGTMISGVIFALFAYISAQLAFNGHGNSAMLSGFIGGLLALTTLLTGASAAGIHLSRQFRDQESMNLAGAFLAALATLPRLLGIFLIIGILVLLLSVGLALLYFICKIPGIGPLLYLVALPLGALLFALLGYAMVFVTPLTGPAVWSGNTVFQTIALLWGVLRQRLLPVIIKAILLGLLTGLVGGLIMGGIFSGLALSSMISAPIVGNFLGNPAGAISALMMGGGDSGHMLTGALGAFLLIASASALPALVWIGGNCIIFDDVSSGLATEEIAERMRKQLEAAKEQAKQAGEKLGEAGRDLAEKAREAKAASFAANSTTATTQPSQCPACSNTVGTDDAFCGNCGHRLAPGKTE